MEANSYSAQTSASDEDLIRRFRKIPPDMAAGNELASRCMPKLRKAILQNVFAKSSICPRGQDPNSFADDALSRANEYFLKGLPTFQFRGSFDGWLATLALRSTLDERRSILGRSKEGPRIVDSLEAVNDNGTEMPADHPSAQPEQLMRDREHRELVTALLILHARSSNRDAESALAIRQRLWGNLTVEEIAVGRGSTDRDVYRLFAHDYEKLNGLLIAHFRITALREL